MGIELLGQLKSDIEDCGKSTLPPQCQGEYIGQQKIYKAFPESGCGLDMINCSPIYPAVNPQSIF